MNQQEQVLQVIHYLASQISLGWNYFIVFNYINQAYKQNRIKGAHTILKNAQLACWDCALLAVTKVVKPHDDSLSIYYLLNCIESNPGVYSSIIVAELRGTELKKQIERHRKDLKEISASLPLTRLIEERDRVVAHLDRKLVNNPDGMFSSPPLDADKLRIAFLRLREILGIYDKQTSSLSLWIDESEDVIRELDYLIRLIDHDKEYKVD